MTPSRLFDVLPWPAGRLAYLAWLPALALARSRSEKKERFLRNANPVARHCVETLGQLQPWCAGVTFVTVSGTFGVFDNHGDDVVWGGLIRGLQPLLPRLDQAVYALVTDLEARGLLDDTLVLVLGEFGRTPVVTPTGGRSHHFDCMSMLVAGGGRARGQVVGSTDARGSEVKEARVTPADLGATVFRHLGIDLASQWIDTQGRPQSIVTEGGRPIPELS
jgi:uncharacterized protein (DUF1501 family)